ncbi:RNI-like protein [Gonapodya prolifera JEL478]|uniref:RNI-like protein n=1 Tax=Gonapodya prolifera (strain JEL478) TaxID=1344416 RepID=A0A139B084_GONPJ|nr:RNI-like protein [Gonapodya prolifera JEL478]|eukprot:KXS22384.1 RNI-like protein [Gonapodya prolifera JEL478]
MEEPFPPAESHAGGLSVTPPQGTPAHAPRIQLPYELIVRVLRAGFESRFDPIDESQVSLLGTVSQLGKSWNAAAERFLYNSVVLQHRDQILRFSRARSSRFPVKKLRILPNRKDPGLAMFRELASHALTTGHVINVDLTGYGLGKEGAEILAQALTLNTTMRHLSVSNNNLMDPGGVAIVTALKTNRGLTDLNLSSNFIRGAGTTAALADVLLVNDVLEVVNMDYNSASYEGISKLASALATNQTLTTLSLQSNALSSDSIAALADSLKENTTLRNLDISYNGVQVKVGYHIRDALNVNHSLVFLGLNSSGLDDIGASALAQGLLRNDSLRELEVYQCPLSDEGRTSLIECKRAGLVIWGL